MNSKDLGADFVFAWPSAQLGVMGSKQAIEIIHRREIAGADDPARARDALAAAYSAEHLAAGTGAADGFIDEVIPPSDTRRRIISAFDSLENVGRHRRRQHGGNIPL
jgi:acetyl-CoA carboxylase carboxyltransferase component